MKKNILIYSIIVLVIIALILIYFFFGTKNEMKNSDEISKIITDSNLEIILNLSDFSQTNYSDSKLLEVAMLLAEKKGYMNESNEGAYFEYVNQSDIHEIIHELTNITIEAPIQIEDFYYQYDSENEYYCKNPSVPTPYEISAVEHIYVDDDIYTIETTATKTEDGEKISEDKIKTKLKFVKNNSYTNYQIIEQTVN